MALLAADDRAVYLTTVLPTFFFYYIYKMRRPVEQAPQAGNAGCADHALRSRSRVAGGDSQATRVASQGRLRARQLGPRRGRIAGGGSRGRGTRGPVLHPQGRRPLERAGAAVPGEDEGRQRQRVARPRRRPGSGLRRVRPVRHRPQASSRLSRPCSWLFPRPQDRLGAGAERLRKPRQLGRPWSGRAGHALPGPAPDGFLWCDAHAVHRRLAHVISHLGHPRDRRLPAHARRGPPRHRSACRAWLSGRLRSGADCRGRRATRLRDIPAAAVRVGPLDDPDLPDVTRRGSCADTRWARHSSS